MSVRAAVTRASSARSSTLGTIRAASRPMMTSTTINSIRVKPRCTARAQREGRRGAPRGREVRAKGRQANPSAAPALASRIKVIGVMAPAPGQSAGVALLSIDGKPPKAIRVGGVVDGDMVLQDISQRSARIGPPDGANFLTIDLPGLPPAATGTLPPPSGVTQTSPPGQGMPAGSSMVDRRNQPAPPPEGVEGGGQMRSPD